MNVRLKPREQKQVSETSQFSVFKMLGEVALPVVKKDFEFKARSLKKNG